MPCGDKNECESMSVSTELTQNTNHEKHEHHKELCSPFCICACCGTNVNITAHASYQVMENPIIHTALSYSLANEDILSNFFGNIWQPPKIC
jgi:hypothetical protein